MNPQDYILNVKPSNPNGTDWILPQDDEVLKDKRNFIARAMTSPTPSSFSRRNKTIPIFDQGLIGSCVGCSGKVCMTDFDKYRKEDLSAMWIYKRAQHYDVWDGENYSGTSVSGACEALRKEGCCLESFYPYVWGEDKAQPLTGAFSDALLRKIDSYYYIPPNSETDRTEDIKKVLLARSLWISFNVRKYFYSIGSDGIVDSEKYMNSDVVGGHAVAVIGWKTIDGKLYWECQNSWGPNWGDRGCFFIEDTLLRRTASSGFYYIKHTSNDSDFEEYKEPEKTFWQKYGKILYGVIGFVAVCGIMLLVDFLVNN